MENQHRQIKGYRELSQLEIDMMNEVKAMGPQLQALSDKIVDHVKKQRLAAAAGGDDAEVARIDAAEAERWADWGRTTFQTGLMYLTRAIAQPTFF